MRHTVMRGLKKVNALYRTIAHNYGTGFSYVRSITGSLHCTKQQKNSHLYWGAKDEGAVYAKEELVDIAEKA